MLIGRALSFWESKSEGPRRFLDKAIAAFSIVPRHKDTAPFFLSMVVPTYNVEPYIERFLASIFGQSSPLKDFEIIIVDDGSTDGTAEIVRQWEGWFPDHIRYVYQENAGPAAARNTGMDLARGSWISFPDPDDFLDVNYFREMLKEVKARHRRPLLAVCSNFIFYYDDIDKFRDGHPQKFRFAKGKIRKNTNNMGEHLTPNANAVWFNMAAIEKHALRFDARVRPAFEDGNFVTRLILSKKNKVVSFVPTAKYYYRKRSAKTSILDTSRSQKEHYLDQLEYGYLPLFDFARKTRGYIPVFLQRQVFYSLFWKIKDLVNHPERLGHLSTEEREHSNRLMETVMRSISPKVIARFKLAGIREEHKVALLALCKNMRRVRTNVYVMQHDDRAGLVQFRYFTGAEDHFTPRIFVNGKEVSSQFPSRTQADFMGRVYYRAHFFWVSMAPGDRVAFSVDGKRCRIKRGGKMIGGKASLKKLKTALRPAVPDQAEEEVMRLRAYVKAMRGTYGGCKVLMDRVAKADDNAEHLYRHMMATGRAKDAYFVLDADSADWGRLKDEGFKLLAYGSDDHIAAQMNAAHVLSSHIDLHILWPVPKRDFGDLAAYEFVFLQHGVTKDDQSRWYNTKAPRLLITTTRPEHASIAADNSPYKFSEREIRLTGFPRHDALWKKAAGTSGSSIVIMPTWRKYLTDESDRKATGQRAKHDRFLSSGFFLNWMSLLNSTRLAELAERHGLRVEFVPHPEFAMYLDDMAMPDHVETVDVRSGVSYQDLFARARLAITDYSSAVFDVAYIQRPVLYFQFDRAEMSTGAHVYKPGYFSYERDGFGPVAETADALVANLEAVLDGREDPVYAERRDGTFPFRDGGCCERVCREIEAL